jgi:4-hydroxybenzoate polyprenyltransferase
MTKGRIRTVLEMIKFEHSVFALPFALVGALLAARAGGALPTVRQLLWIVVAMVGARSAAMTLNRLADIEYDRRNPRTANRALPAGELSVGFAWMFTAVSSAVLVLAAWQLNPLGFCLGISHAAAWIAIRGSLDLRMLILCAAVPLWVGGFDVLYACQDVEFDKAAGLFSIPRKLGISRALEIARGMHVVMVILLAWLAWSFHLAWPAWVGIGVVAALLAYEHSLLKPNDLSKMNAAFFTVNGYISLLFLLFWGAAAVAMRP